MKAYYLKQLRKRIHYGLSVEAFKSHSVVHVEHSRLFNRYSIPIENGEYLSYETIRRIIHEVMKSEVYVYRKTLNQLKNIGWWSAIIMGIIFCIWLSK